MSFITENLRINITTVNNEVNKITITAQLPNPEYDIQIRLITFLSEQAEILVDVIEPNPNPDNSVIQVVKEKELITFVDMKYFPTVKVIEKVPTLR